MHILPQQIKRIHTLKAKARIDEETYRDMLYTGYRAASSKELAWDEAEELIRKLGKLAGQAVFPRRRPKQGWGRDKYRATAPRYSSEMSTPAQRRAIEAMWKKVSRAPTDEAREAALRTMLKRIAKVDDINWLTHAGAVTMMQCLNKMGAQRVDQFNKQKKQSTGGSNGTCG